MTNVLFIVLPILGSLIVGLGVARLMMPSWWRYARRIGLSETEARTEVIAGFWLLVLAWWVALPIIGMISLVQRTIDRTDPEWLERETARLERETGIGGES